ncbi:3-hydroxyacyl-CoA dehydrogenase [Fibrella forsythiae]|uniref:3-hydroxyacyl-CoA dehydrogenase n=1 Tax=Fibrella forsythiae TaxID=2817061 RepID=A0ABS3JI98_9BACT|nr:3-hydroxyacyl-CoA dehydrogenase [Fibrella forsythiae]MBO0948974.1 3-hydroxyacyl-CoA dehydrogenase [Fibrella forsythiae]
MDIQHVTVFGAGVLGSQIAFQTAFHQFNVTICDISNDQLHKVSHRFMELGDLYKRDLGASQAAIDATLQRLTCSSEMAEAVRHADLAIEAIPEDVQQKKEFYLELGQVAPAKTIFATNSSTLLPSQFAKETGRPDCFLALHFANEIWKNNTAEIMGHAGTDPGTFNAVVDFAKAIGMLAIPIHKEQPGYVLNTLLMPFLRAALELYLKGIADPETIDKTWMKATGAPKGPFAIYDMVGLTTAYNITKLNADKTGDRILQRAAQTLKERFIDQGKLGVLTGEGFYTYPNPAYQQPDFLH